jgi:hypothetical protein
MKSLSDVLAHQAAVSVLSLIREAEKSRYIGRELMHWLRLEIPTLEDGESAFGCPLESDLN